MNNYEQYCKSLDCLYICAMSKLMMEAKDRATIEDCYMGLSDHGFNTLSGETIIEIPEMPEVSIEEVAEALFSDFMKLHTTAHKVGV